MFARDTIDVSCPFDIAAERLRRPGWLQPIWAAAAGRLASDPMSGDYVDPSPKLGSGFEIGQPHTCSASFLVHVFWEISTSPDLMITLDGDLRATPVQCGVTQLQLQATYRLSLPDYVDGTKRIATASLREVLAGVAASLGAVTTS